MLFRSRGLRMGLSYLGLGCDYDRMPWPIRDIVCEQLIVNCIEEIRNER